MKLYEINQNFRDLWIKVEEQEGELTEEDIQALESLELAKDEKVKAYGVIHREIMSDINGVKQEIERLKKIEKRLQNKADWLENSLSMFMLENDMKEYKSVEVNISFRASKQLKIEDEMLVPREWLKEEVVVKPDKQAIKTFIENGGKVEGCEIISKQNIQIK